MTENDIIYLILELNNMIGETKWKAKHQISGKRNELSSFHHNMVIASR